VLYIKVLNNRRCTNTKMKNAQLNLYEHFSLNNILCCYEINISVNQHLNSSLREEDEQTSVHTRIMKTGTKMTAHTNTHRYILIVLILRCDIPIVYKLQCRNKYEQQS